MTDRRTNCLRKPFVTAYSCGEQSVGCRLHLEGLGCERRDINPPDREACYDEPAGGGNLPNFVFVEPKGDAHFLVHYPEKA